jgi:hypothetical protein
MRYHSAIDCRVTVPSSSVVQVASQMVVDQQRHVLSTDHGANIEIQGAGWYATGGLDEYM